MQTWIIFCYYESIHSPHPSGSSAISGVKKVDFQKVTLFSLCGYSGLLFNTCLYPGIYHFSSSLLKQILSVFPNTHSLCLSSDLCFFPVWQSCARCHVAAMVLAQRASVSVRRAGLAPRATREHAIHAARNMASATTGPASVSLAGRGNTAISVSCVCVRVCADMCKKD